MDQDIFEGGCTCGGVRYRLLRRPMFIHCCHCTWCRKESGAAFALNGMVEGTAVELSRGEIEIVDTPTKSGRGQKISRCPKCRVALWGNFSKAAEKIHFVRLGTLDNPATFTPDVHIFTSSKLPWVLLGDEIPSFTEFYTKSETWLQESIDRYDRALSA